MLILRLIERHISRRRLQSILFVLGVALGVAVGVAIELANNSASRAFALSTESIAGRTTHQIIGGPGGIDTALYTTLRAELGVRTSAPIIQDYVRAVDLGDQPLQMLGVDLIAEAPFRNYLTDQEFTESTADGLADFNRFLTASDAGLISQSLANRFDLSVGDTITIRVNTDQVEMTIIGLLQPNDTLSEEALDDLLLVDIATAQELLGMEGKLTRIDLILPPDIDLAPVQALLPQGVAITTPQAQSDALEQMTDAFEVNLQALSLLALVVGVFLIYNTVMFSVVQRRAVIGIMRSLGTSKRQIFRLVLGEAMLLGAIGTGLGLLMGVFMGQATVDAVSQTISDLYFRVNVQSVTVSEMTLLRGGAIGLAASLVAALVPAIDATRTTPAGSMRRSDLEDNTLKLIPYITGVGLLMIVAGVAILQFQTTNLVVSFTSLFLVIIGAAFFTPLGMIIIMNALTPITGALFGVLGRMAPRSVIRSISRTAVAVAALTLAVSVIVGVGVMISSFRATVSDWLVLSLGADIFVATPGLSTDSSTDIDPALTERIAATEGVSRVGYVRNVRVLAPDFPDLPPVNLAAINFDITDGARRFDWLNVPDGEDYRDYLSAGQVMVTEAFAFRRGITPEDNTITLLTDNGEQTFEVFGVYYDYSSDQGFLIMDIAVYRAAYDDPFVSSYGLFVDEGVNVQTVIDRLRTDTLVGQDLEVQSNRELRQGALEVFDRTFSITVALQILAVIVAFIGILSALMALQLENMREYGIMRANGMTPAQIRNFTLIQTGLMGISAGIMALPIGLALSVILTNVINVRSFGWTMDFALPPEEFLQAFLVAVFASLIAGIYPAIKSSSISAAAALRNE